MSDANNAVKDKLEALKKRIEPSAKAADLLEVARELGEIGAAMARAESTSSAASWPRDMNEREHDTSWGKDPDGGARG